MDIICLGIACISAIAILYILIFNKIQDYRTKIENIEGIIDEDLRKKYDILLSIEDIFTKEKLIKKDYLKDFKNLKGQNISNFDFYRKAAEAENIIENLINDLDISVKNKDLKEKNGELKLLNEKLSAGISYYNHYASKMNNFIRKFPCNIVSKIHHCKPKMFFDGKNMLDDDINDFKL